MVFMQGIKNRTGMKIVYIAHVIAGDVEANLADLRRIIRWINITYPDVVPFCPYYSDVVSLDDSVPAERTKGLFNGLAIINRAAFDELWLTGPTLSGGMRAERQKAKDRRIPVIDMIGNL